MIAHLYVKKCSSLIKWLLIVLFVGVGALRVKCTDGAKEVDLMFGL